MSRTLLGRAGLALILGGILPTANAAPPSPSPAHEISPMQHAKGTFDVSVKPLAFENAPESAALSRLTIDKTFHGALEGTSVGQMLAVGTAFKDSGVYVAVERVTGTLEGRAGSFALHHIGKMRGGQYALNVAIVPDSGRDALAGIEGELRIIIDKGVHYYELDYRLPAKP